MHHKLTLLGGRRGVAGTKLFFHIPPPRRADALQLTWRTIARKLIPNKTTKQAKCGSACLFAR
jgi:hypothetical protein